MRKVFADTFYWVALANPSDQWRARVRTLSSTLPPAQIYTTDEVLVEFLTHFSAYGSAMRSAAVAFLRGTLANPEVTVLPQTRDSFLAGVELYEARSDKTYSLTDCISMQTMKAAGITEVLTHDEHFAQEGFRALFRD